ncbi:MAG: Hypoxanthine/guanine phosphoribosyltransferase [Methanomassiliicoccales archaeon PtaU1.Bin124]|nr:MAG: Hypoxanthine/guanine phosphoribosyltransferase [Methanomassiliicoccales archaeon PtaU1.Bin124]
MLERLKKSLEDAPVVSMGDYQYFVHPITDGVPRMNPALLREVLDAVVRAADLHCDVILAPEAMGIPLVVPISLRTGIPYVVVRKRCYSLPGEVSVKQVTGYSEKDMFINDIKSGDRVVIIDDVISTGGTLRAMVQALKTMGAEIVDIVVVVEKVGHKENLEEELGVHIKTLVKVEVRNGQVNLVT